MTVQPIHHWRFEERKGTTTVDAVSGVQAELSKAELDGHGRIGNAVRLLAKDSHINIDLALTSLFLAREDDRGRKIAQEVIPLTPSIFSPLRLVPKESAKLRALAYLVLAGMNTVATFSNFGFGIKFLRDDMKALEEAS